MIDHYIVKSVSGFIIKIKVRWSQEMKYCNNYSYVFSVPIKTWILVYSEQVLLIEYNQVIEYTALWAIKSIIIVTHDSAL